METSDADVNLANDKSVIEESARLNNDGHASTSSESMQSRSSDINQGWLEGVSTDLQRETLAFSSSSEKSK